MLAASESLKFDEILDSSANQDYNKALFVTPFLELVFAQYTCATGVTTKGATHRTQTVWLKRCLRYRFEAHRRTYPIVLIVSTLDRFWRCRPKESIDTECTQLSASTRNTTMRP